MIQSGDTVIAGVSGGADSVCMLLILSSFCREISVGIEVVHVNHQIRREAAKDAEYVKTLSERLHLPFYLHEVNVKEKAERWNCGLEEAGRKIRYHIFEEHAAIYGEKAKIAVAHNKNDLAETTLFHLFRGSSITGLSGILPIRGQIIRPLLCVERKEIEAFLMDHTMVHGDWCIDHTNLENTYTRNRIRNELFPYIEENICRQAVAHVANLAGDMAELREFMESETERAFQNALVELEEKRKLALSIERIASYPELIQRQIMVMALEKLNGSKKDITAVHIRALLSLTEKKSGKRLNLPYDCIAEREYGILNIHKNNGEKKEELYYDVSALEELKIENINIRFCLRKADDYSDIPRKAYTKCFDYDKIKSHLVIRNRKMGDFLSINEKGNRKSLKEYFITEKVPRLKRETLLVLAEDSHILWVIGMRMSEYYKCSADTKNILEVTVENRNPI